MKQKRKCWMILILLLFPLCVFAKDNSYSFNQYEEETLYFLEDSYNENLQQNGMVTAGVVTIKKDDQKKEQGILIRYKKNGTVAWSTLVEKEEPNKIVGLDYTYNEQKEIDGYLLVITEESGKTTFQKIDFTGELAFEKATSLPEEVTMEKLISCTTENDFSGYLGIASSKDYSYLVRYDREFNVLWVKQEGLDQKFLDVAEVKEKGEPTSYVVLREKEDEVELSFFTLEGEVVGEPFIIEKKKTTSLASHEDGFVLFGSTEEVKVKKGNESYYLVKYDSSGKEEWDSFGNIAINPKEKMILKTLPAEDKYLFLYQNEEDDSYEVLKLDSDGVVEKKVKKIKNSYYHFENFQARKNVLYFVGQIDCPEDDECDFDENSLFLVSDEDKVIEVKDRTSEQILAITVGFILLVGVLVYWKRKRKKK